MDKGGNIYYRCRWCGAVYIRAHAPDVALALQCAVYDFMSAPSDWGMSIHATDIHKCDEVRWGVADLVGGREDA